MIYVTGDTHGNQARFLDGKWDSLLTADDTLIVCGDFGYIFDNDSSENSFLDWLEQRAYDICFLDGNHENFPVIFEYPETVWNGGKVHQIRRNIYHLMRGQVFDIEGKTIFTMGGAYSVDRSWRRLNESYWEEELPCDAEYKEAVRNLQAHDFKLDFILTHTAPDSMIYQLCCLERIHMLPRCGADAELTGFLEWVKRETTFRHWFFGHWHIDRNLSEQFTALLFDTKMLV